ncbi:MAG: 30S ribosome-binding factor RbfA [Clostridiales bacterium]|nr:30S ribosome-binding factor RbfA [Clostridiales bacterium]MDY2835540.1 30S ribosome-binding factor RbfA [Candidatus Aphodomonas sp.]
MNFDRTDRISEEVRREVDRIIREDVRDPRVAGTWSITRADVTRDLRYAKIRVSVLEEEQRKPLVKALKNAAGFIRRELGKNLRLRYTPELLFEEDDNIAYGVHIASILSDVKPESDETNISKDDEA